MCTLHSSKICELLLKITLYCNTFRIDDEFLDISSLENNPANNELNLPRSSTLSRTKHLNRPENNKNDFNKTIWLVRQFILKLLAKQILDILAWLYPLDESPKLHANVTTNYNKQEAERYESKYEKKLDDLYEGHVNRTNFTGGNSEDKIRCPNSKDLVSEKDFNTLNEQLTNNCHFTGSRGIHIFNYLHLIDNQTGRLLGFMNYYFPNEFSTLKQAGAGSEIVNLIKNDPIIVVNNKKLLPYLINNENLKSSSTIPQLSILSLWDVENYPLSIPDSFKLLGKDYETRAARLQNLDKVDILALSEVRRKKYSVPTNPLVIGLAFESLKIAAQRSPESVVFYMPQIVQLLRNKQILKPMTDFFNFCVETSSLVAHQFIWNMNANEFRYDDAKGTGKDKDQDLYYICQDLKKQIHSRMTDIQINFYKKEFSFFKEITDISGTIKPYKLGKPRKEKALKELAKVNLVKGCYLPSNPTCLVTKIDKNSATPLQSHAKAPYLAKFEVLNLGFNKLEKFGESNEQAKEEILNSVNKSKNTNMQAAIFKVGDDIRQDMLALQIIKIFEHAFKRAGLGDLYMYPYKVVATSPGCGVIECVPDSKSRDQIGRAKPEPLLKYFLEEYGQLGTANFEEARQKYMKSLAAYSIVLYILQIKDRHNGNMLITKEGYLVHIDFGFMFESSPGGNMGFEPDFKLAHEMVALFTGDVMNVNPYTQDSLLYKQFANLTCKAFLAIRPYFQEILILVDAMMESCLPCFRGKTLDGLRSRFAPDITDKEAISHMRALIDKCYCSNFAKFYDYFQNKQNGIAYFN